jgi:hypothetical protein
VAFADDGNGRVGDEGISGSASFVEREAAH